MGMGSGSKDGLTVALVDGGQASQYDNVGRALHKIADLLETIAVAGFAAGSTQLDVAKYLDGLSKKDFDKAMELLNLTGLSAGTYALQFENFNKFTAHPEKRQQTLHQLTLAGTGLIVTGAIPSVVEAYRNNEDPTAAWGILGSAMLFSFFSILAPKIIDKFGDVWGTLLMSLAPLGFVVFSSMLAATETEHHKHYRDTGGAYTYAGSAFLAVVGNCLKAYANKYHKSSNEAQAGPSDSNDPENPAAPAPDAEAGGHGSQSLVQDGAGAGETKHTNAPEGDDAENSGSLRDAGDDGKETVDPDTPDDAMAKQLQQVVEELLAEQELVTAKTSTGQVDASSVKALLEAVTATGHPLKSAVAAKQPIEKQVLTLRSNKHMNQQWWQE